MEKYGLSLVQTCNKRLISISFNKRSLSSRQYRQFFTSIQSNNSRNDQISIESSLSLHSSPPSSRTITATNVTPLLRYQLMKDLIKDKKFHEIVAKGDKLLFEKDIINNITKIRWKNDVNLKEFIIYFNSLIVLRRWDQIDKMMNKCISQFSISSKNKIIKLLDNTFKQMLQVAIDKSDRDLLLKTFVIWSIWIKRLNGTCELLDYIRDKNLLYHVLHFLRSVTFIHKQGPVTFFLQEVLLKVKNDVGASAASQLASTFINLLSRDENFKGVTHIWQFKIKHGFPITSNDLTHIMKAYVYRHNYKKLPKLYDTYPNAHGDTIQFDYLLLSYTRLKNWSALQRQFDELFSIGKLPNVNHYEIVIFAMAYERELDKVEMLYDQFLRRGMIPTYSIIQSLLYVHYKCNKFLSCFQQFQLFEKYNIQPNSNTYLIMFKVFKELNNMEGSLKLLKDITQKLPSMVNEEICSTMIQQCSKVTNYAIAQEIFNVMIDYYNIQPTPLSVSSLMMVYNSCQKYNSALQLFNKYSKKFDSTYHNLGWLYEKAMDSYIGLGQYENCTDLVKTLQKIHIKDKRSYYNTLLTYELEVENNTDKAMELLKETIANNQVKPLHIEKIMMKFNNPKGYDSILKLYDMMIKAKIPLNSKILYYIIKATFQLQMSTKNDLTKTIQLLEDIMDNVANGKIRLVPGSQLHPSVFGWPIRTIARDYNPKIAMGLLNKYNELFYDKDDKSFRLNNKLINLRTMIILYGESNQWDEVSYYFQQLLLQLKKFSESSSATMKNIKLDTIFNGIIDYKLKQLDNNGKIADELPNLLEKILKQGYILNNYSWNEIVSILLKDPRTLEVAMRYINDKLIYGFNIIHKNRLLRNIKNNVASGHKDSEKSWSLTVKRLRSEQRSPNLYLRSDRYNQLIHYMRMKLNGLNFHDYNKLIMEDWCLKYPHIMKNFLLLNHSSVIHDWDKFEKSNESFLKELRTVKRANVIINR